jgi:hypothetical protein
MKNNQQGKNESNVLLCVRPSFEIRRYRALISNHRLTFLKCFSKQQSEVESRLNSEKIN